MERKRILTKDGSHSIAIPDLNVTYHSVHGAIQESKHVFINAGIYHLLNSSSFQPVNIFEMGFGTGLNAFLTAIEAEEKQVSIRYTAVEQFPLSLEEASALNYSDQLGHEHLFQKIHDCIWGEEVTISTFFALRKEKASLLDFSTAEQFNIIYYDAFAPNAQPELWTKEVFEKLFSMTLENESWLPIAQKAMFAERW